MHFHSIRLWSTKNGLKPRAQRQSCPKLRERVRMELFRSLKNQYSSGPQYPDKLRNIFMAARICDVLKHKARINEAKIIIRQSLQLNIFIQLKTAIRQVVVQLMRQGNHRR